MWGKSICYLSKENIPHLEISETDTSLCGLMWRHMTCCRLLFWPPSRPDNLRRKQNASIFHEIQTSIAFNRKFRGTANIRLANFTKNWVFIFSMEDGGKVQDEAWSLFFFISAWLDVKNFPWSGLLYVLLTNVGSKKNGKKLFFFFLDKIYTCVGNYEVQQIEKGSWKLQRKIYAWQICDIQVDLRAN